MNIEIEGFTKDYQQWVARYVFSLSQMGCSEITVDVYHSSCGYYSAVPSVLIRHPIKHSLQQHSNQYIDINEFGDTEQQAIEVTLTCFWQQLKSLYPHKIPADALVDRKLADCVDNSKVTKSLQPDDDWQKEKVQHNRTSGAYIEFQLEQHGTYEHWHKDSVFVGIGIFNLVYDVFCTEIHDFDTYGINLFSVNELPALQTKINAFINKLEGIDSLSAFSEQIQPFRYWSWIAEQTTWQALKTATLDLLTEVNSMVKQGQAERRALFVLGV